MFAVDLFIKVKFIQTALFQCSLSRKFCETQRACRDGALDIIEEFTAFLVIADHLDSLKKRAETRQAVKHMLDSISAASKYISEKTSAGVRGIIGML